MVRECAVKKRAIPPPSRKRSNRGCVRGTLAPRWCRRARKNQNSRYIADAHTPPLVPIPGRAGISGQHLGARVGVYSESLQRGGGSSPAPLLRGTYPSRPTPTACCCRTPLVAGTRRIACSVGKVGPVTCDWRHPGCVRHAGGGVHGSGSVGAPTPVRVEKRRKNPCADGHLSGIAQAGMIVGFGNAHCRGVHTG